MKFTGRQYDIIKLISEDIVDDVVSFIKYWYSDKIFEHDKETIQMLKRKDYEENEEKIEEYVKSFIGKKKLTMIPVEGANLLPNFTAEPYTEEEINDLKDKLTDFSLNDNSFFVTININEKNYVIDTLHNTFYIADDLGAVVDFLFVWDFLLEQKLIIERDNQINEQDCIVFFRKEKVVDYILSERYTKVYEGPNESKTMDYRFIYRYEDIAYAKDKLIPNENLLDICSEYLNKKILITNAIKNYVRRNFSPLEETAFKWTKISVWTAVIFSIISIIISIVGTWISLNNNSIPDELINDIHSIEKVINFNKEKFDEIDENVMDQTKELSQILNTIQEYIKNQEKEAF